MTDAKFKLEDILNKQKAPPQILDLVHIKIESEEDYKGVIEKIPDYKIKPERVSQIPKKRDLKKKWNWTLIPRDFPTNILLFSYLPIFGAKIQSFA